MGNNVECKVCVRCMTYNHAPYIKDALDGFCSQQTGFPFVCTIVDDASSDGEQAVIINYLKDNFNLPPDFEEIAEQTDDYTFYFAQHKTNENCFFAVYLLKYNHYRKKSKEQYISKWMDSAKYIAMCEGDDFWVDSQKLLKQVNFLEKNPSYVMSHTGISYFYEFERKYYDSRDIEINTIIQKEGLTREKILSGYRIQYVSVVVLSDAFRKARQMDPFLFGGYFMMGDTQLWYNLFKMGKIHFLPETTSVYRKNKDSATRSASIEKSLRFTLSSKELRLYLARKDNLSPLFQKKAYKEYESALKRYMLFNSSFVPLYPLQLSSPNPLNSVFVPLKRLYFVFVNNNRSFLGYMKRKCKSKI